MQWTSNGGDINYHWQSSVFAFCTVESAITLLLIHLKITLYFRFSTALALITIASVFSKLLFQFQFQVGNRLEKSRSAPVS
jgi:hypothetical protein